MKQITLLACLTVGALATVTMSQNMAGKTMTYGGVKVKVLGQKPTKFPMGKSKSDWKKTLTAAQYHILIEDGTDRPFKSKYHDNHAKGVYYSVASGKPLFRSDDKFESGTGWPSFTKPVSDSAVIYVQDGSAGMQRIEVIEAATGTHLGHVFMDGPKPTGLRFCMNGEALVFRPSR